VALPVAGIGAVAYSDVLVVVILAVSWVASIADAVIEVINAAFDFDVRRRSGRASHVHPTNRDSGHRNNHEVP
jgi:hypothetical protein